MNRTNFVRVVFASAVALLLVLVGVWRPLGAAQATRPAAVPTFTADPEWPKVPAKWKLGDVVSMAVDENNHAWLLHRPRTLSDADLKNAAPPVLEFDEAGNFVQGWGGEGAGYDWPQREHGIYIDYKGYVWIGGNYCPARNLPHLKPVFDDQLLKFTKDGKFVKQIGKPSGSKGNADQGNVHEPADVVVWQKTNEAFVADGYGNHRIIVFDADTGAFKRSWGAFGNKPVDADFCPSDDNARPPDSVADGDGPPQFNIVHAVKISADGFVYVGDRENKRLQVFTLAGKFVNQYVYRGAGNFAAGIALSRDPEQKFLYVSGQGSPIHIFDRKTMKEVGSVATEQGIRGGGHQFVSDLKGNLLTAQSRRGAQRLLLTAP